MDETTLPKDPSTDAIIHVLPSIGTCNEVASNLDH